MLKNGQTDPVRRKRKYNARQDKSKLANTVVDHRVIHLPSPPPIIICTIVAYLENADKCHHEASRQLSGGYVEVKWQLIAAKLKIPIALHLFKGI